MADALQSLAEINAAIESAIDSTLEVVDAPIEETIEAADELPEGEAPEGDPEVSDEPQLSDAEQKAVARGWQPKELFKGDPEEWVDAAEFNRRQPLFEKIGAQSKEVKDLRKKLDAVVKYTAAQEQKIREKVIAEFEAKKREAVKFGDVDAYEAADQELKKVAAEEAPKFDEEEEAQPAQAQQLPDYVQKFAKENPWFETDIDMQAVMVRRHEMLVINGMGPEQAIGEALKHVKSTFPNKFANPNKSKPPSVMSGNRDARPASTPKRSIANLSHDERLVWHSVKGMMTEQKFLESLEA
jgi:hypothetical protein